MAVLGCSVKRVHIARQGGWPKLRAPGLRIWLTPGHRFIEQRLRLSLPECMRRPCACPPPNAALSAWSPVERAARQLLEMVDQAVGAGGGGIGVARDDRREGRGVDLGVLRESRPRPRSARTRTGVTGCGSRRCCWRGRNCARRAARPRGSSGSHAGSGRRAVAAAAARISLASRCISARSRSRARTAARRTTRVLQRPADLQQLQLLDARRSAPPARRGARGSRRSLRT